MQEKTEKPRIAVTGANGLVGSHLVEHLAKAGFPVVAIVRNPGKAPHLTAFVEAMKGSIDCKIVQGDIGDSQSTRDALRLVDVVVHAAASVNPYGDRHEIFATNVGGTKNVMANAKLQGLKQFIFISSLSVITGQGDQVNVDESAPLRPCGESYADSKIEAEKYVMSEATNMRVTSIRPGFIYGPREQSWMPRLINNIKNGKAMLIDGGKRDTNVIYIGNLCRAVEKAILNTSAFGQVYNLTDGQTISKKKLFDTIADGLSLPRVTKNVPRPVAKLACVIISSIAKNLPPEKQQNLSRFSPAAFRLAAVNQGFSVAKAERELAYTDRIPFDEGMARTLEYFKNAKSENTGELSAAGQR